MNWDSMRLARLSLPAKVLVTLFLGLVGVGYLVATANIYFQHQDADLEPGMSPDDLRRKFHGLEKEITPEATVTVNSTMLEQVRPGGDMREHLDPGGEPAVRALISWLEDGAKEEDFAKADLAQAGDPSATEVIMAHCVECHHADGGDMEDVPFAADADAEPEFAKVAEVATPEYERHQSGPQRVTLAPTSLKKLVHITHAHILTIPVFALIVGVLFLMTGLPTWVKLILGPLPMLAVIADIGSWWLARFIEPFIYVIAASGAVFGASYGLQILCILASMWLGRTGGQSASGE
jgi:mono/diheme cytochrome c family protein